LYANIEISLNLVTAEITAKFLKPVPTNVQIDVVGEVLERRGRIIITKSELLINGVIYASATAKIFVLGT